MSLLTNTEVYLYYRTKFPYDLMKLEDAKGYGIGEYVYETGVVHVDSKTISLESPVVQQWSQKDYNLFASALFFSVLIDQVCYTYYQDHYRRFESLTGNPKFVDYFGHCHPKYILCKMGSDYTETTRRCYGNVGAQLLPEAIEVFHHVTDNFLSEHIPEISSEKFWNRCLDEVALIPEKYIGQKSDTTNHEEEYARYALLDIKNSEALLEAKRAWDERVKREEEEWRLREEFREELGAALVHSTSKLFGGANPYHHEWPRFLSVEPTELKGVSLSISCQGLGLSITAPHLHRFRSTRRRDYITPEIADTVMEQLFGMKLEIESDFGGELCWMRDSGNGFLKYSGREERNKNDNREVRYLVTEGFTKDLLNKNMREENIKRVVDSSLRLEKSLLPRLKEIADNIKEAG